VGQEHVSRTLKNAIDSGRVAHAFLFTGARGVGKTTSARLLAKALNCETGPTPEPCNACLACIEITAGTSVDVFEIDGASNTSVDDIRELRENVRYLPSTSRYKIFIIDEVHMLSTSAFNALLKTLEEPPPHVKFIFATTEPHKVPITILSRCQRFDFRRIPLETIVGRLRHIVQQEGVTISDGALGLIARKGDGSMRDSLSLLDQVLACCGEEVADADAASVLGVADRRLLLRVVGSVMGGDAADLLRAVREADEVGLSLKQFLQELIEVFRCLLIVCTVRDVTGILDLSDGELGELRGLAASADGSDIQRWVAMLLKAESDLAGSSFPRLVLEATLVRMASLPPAVPVGELLDRIALLSADGGGGAVASQRPVWKASSSPASASPGPTLPSPPSSSVRPESVAPPAAPLEAAVPEQRGWAGLVEYVRKKKPMLAVSLERVHPLAVTAGRIEIGVRKGGFEATALGQAESLESLGRHASEFFGTPTQIVLTSVADTTAVPPTMAAEKDAVREERSRAIDRDGRQHPSVVAALEIFSASIDEIRDVGGTE
jgi:DNA polymerase-3 subunit gamma/tau